MEMVTAGNVTSFTGTLMQRRYKPGQTYVQLVFMTAQGARLSLSRNLEFVRSLSLGLTYEIRGTERALGNKKYIHEPTASLIEETPSKFRQHRKLLSATIVLAGIVVFGAATMLSGGTDHNTATAGSAASNKPKVITEKPAVLPVKDTSATTQTPSPAVAPTPTASSPTVRRSNNSTTSNASQAPTSSPSQSQTPAVTNPPTPANPEPTPQPEPEPTPEPPADPPVEGDGTQV